MEKIEKDRKLYRFLKKFPVPLICRFLRYHAAPCDIEGPCLVISNHTTDFDPIFVTHAFNGHMYYVASEHVFRKGFLSRLLVSAFDPIARKKGSTDAAAALDIVRRLRNNANVCLFAEGNRSFNGVTGPVFSATGKLLKAARCSLVTFRISGGYLATPRWADKRRKGPINGELIRVYSPDELKAMTPEEINAAIAADIFEDAFARQSDHPAEYRGKHLAEHLERALYCCPKCGKAGTMHSKNDIFSCDCGFSVRYTETGFFTGESSSGLPFQTVRDWDKWQLGRLKEIIHASEKDSAIFIDSEATLSELSLDHAEKEIASGALSATINGLALEKEAFSWNEVVDMAVCGPARIEFTTTEARYYEITFDGPASGKKYHDLYRIVKSEAD